MFADAKAQLFIFIMCCIFGLCLGVFFDIFKIGRKMSNPSAISVGIQDGIFWIISAIGTFVFLLIIDDGRMRLYELFTIFSSWLLYYATLSRYTVRAGVYITEKIITLLLLPLRLVCKIFKKPVFLAVSISRKSFTRTGRIVANIGRKWQEYIKNFKKMRKKI